MLKRTPLFTHHQQLGARLIDFGGWEMPVQYSGIVDEHLAVRQAAGLFDISHMGEVFVHGPAAVLFLNQTLTNDATRLTPGLGQYTLMCNPAGGVIDDLYLYCLAPEDFLLIVNASRVDADVAWLAQQLRNFSGPCQVSNRSDEFGAVAVQGPRVAEFITQVVPRIECDGQSSSATLLRKNQIARVGDLPDTWIARTGYTGEDGFELFAPADRIGALWNQMLAAGTPCGLKPAGLGARDTLRTEMCYPLYGHELDEQTTPLEAGLGTFVALEKGEFTGRSVLARQKLEGVARKCVAFKLLDKGAPPRPHYPIWSADATPTRLGEVVSGTQSPSLNLGVGLGYVPVAQAQVGTRIDIEIRGRRVPAMVAAKPLYRKPMPA